LCTCDDYYITFICTCTAIPVKIPSKCNASTYIVGHQQLSPIRVCDRYEKYKKDYENEMIIFVRAMLTTSRQYNDIILYTGAVAGTPPPPLPLDRVCRRWPI
jgi:hypothetical protein